MSPTFIILVIFLGLVALAIDAIVAHRLGNRLGMESNKRVFEERLRAEKETSEKRLLELQVQQSNALREARDETAHLRSSMERENVERRTEILRQERRLQQKEEALDRKIDILEQRERKLGQRERSLEQTREEIEGIKRQQQIELERVAQMSEEDAKELLL